MGYTIRHAFDTDVDGFWRLFFDRDYNRAIAQDFFEFSGYEVLEERTLADGTLHRRVECKGKRGLPALVRAIVGDGGYVETGSYDSVARRYVGQSVPLVGAGKFAIDVEVFAQPLAARRCERIVRVDNTVDIFGVGRTVERAFERSQRESFDGAAEFTNSWIRAHGY